MTIIEKCLDCQGDVRRNYDSDRFYVACKNNCNHYKLLQEHDRLSVSSPYVLDGDVKVFTDVGFVNEYRTEEILQAVGFIDGKQYSFRLLGLPEGEHVIKLISSENDKTQMFKVMILSTLIGWVYILKYCKEV